MADSLWWLLPVLCCLCWEEVSRAALQSQQRKWKHRLQVGAGKTQFGALPVRKGQFLSRATGEKGHLARCWLRCTPSTMHPVPATLLQAGWGWSNLLRCLGRRRRRGALSQLVPSPTVSPDGLTTALVIPDLGYFWASLAVNKLLLIAREFWDVLQHTSVMDVRLTCHSF